MSRTPSYILRNCDLYVFEFDLIGQLTELTLPVPKMKTEEIRNAGMIMPIEVGMGYEKLELSFTMGNVDPRVLATFGIAAGKLLPFMATGALVSEDGATHSAVCLMSGFIKSADLGSWKPGEKSETKYEVAIREYALTIDGAPVIAVTPYDVLIGGVSQAADQLGALLTI